MNNTENIRNADFSLVKELQSNNQTPCLSLYMPTHRSHPDNLKDPINYKNLVKSMESSLSQKYSSTEVEQNLEPFNLLASDSEFWNHTSLGLALFSAGGMFHIVLLHEPVSELAIVADSFHTKPLRQYLQTVYRYHVLGVTLEDIVLYEGTRHSLYKINLPDKFPKTITEALGEELTDKHLTAASYGGARGESSAMFHGHGSKKEEVDKDAERFFRVVSQYVHDKYSKPSGIPLILAALPEHHNLFHRVNKNPLLLKKGIDINPKAISTERLAELAWEAVEQDYVSIINELAGKFMQAKANDLGSDQIKEVIKAAEAGRVDTLLIEADRIVSLKDKAASGNIQTGSMDNPEVDDLLDDIGEIVINNGGTVKIVPAEHMPSKTGVAAIYRY